MDGKAKENIKRQLYLYYYNPIPTTSWEKIEATNGAQKQKFTNTSRFKKSHFQICPTVVANNKNWVKKFNKNRK